MDHRRQLILIILLASFFFFLLQKLPTIVGVSHQSFMLAIVGKFIYLGFYVAFTTVQIISRRVVGRAEETST